MSKSKSKSKTYTTSELAKHFDISVVSASRFIVKHKFKPIKTGQHNAKYYGDVVFKQMEEYYQNKPKTQEKQTYPATKANHAFHYFVPFLMFFEGV